MTDLQVVGRQEDDAGYLTLGGEIRLEISSRVYEEGRKLIAAGARHLVVDMGGVTFMDSASLGSLIRLESEISADGGRFVLVEPSSAVERVLVHAGLVGRFVTAADEASARTLFG